MHAASFAFIFLLAFTTPAFAQTLFQGRIDVTVIDSQSRAIPGALVEIAGVSNQSQTTDDKGRRIFSTCRRASTCHRQPERLPHASG